MSQLRSMYTYRKVAEQPHSPVKFEFETCHCFKWSITANPVPGDFYELCLNAECNVTDAPEHLKNHLEGKYQIQLIEWENDSSAKKLIFEYSEKLVSGSTTVTREVPKSVLGDKNTVIRMIVHVDRALGSDERQPFRRILTYILDMGVNPKRLPLDEEDLKIAAYLIDLGETIDKGDFGVEIEEHLSSFEDDLQDLSKFQFTDIYYILRLGWTPEDDECHKIKMYPDVVHLPGKPNMIQFAHGEFVELEKVKEAVAYFGSKTGLNNNGSKARPSFEKVHYKFRFIRNRHHLDKLREYETLGFTKANRKNNLEFISKELEKEVRMHVENGKILHDSVLRFLIAGIIKKYKIDIQNFVGSESWLNGWKARFGITSRKITKFVSTVRHKTRDQIEKDSKEFVTAANQVFPLYHPSNIYNADQSGFQLEMHTARTLTLKGSKNVHCVVGSESSTTHSYTVLPLISASGKLHPKLFVTLKEPKGQFPKKGHFQASNLEVTCHTSHIMTKELMKVFFQKIVFDSSMPKDALLIVDSWNSWKDTAAIDSVTPSSNKLKILTIPARCTGRIQPCDVGIFGSFKKVVKTITNYAQLTNTDYKFQTRDETLKLISLVWRQLCSPKLEKWAQYAWVASGYDVPRPTTFHTPSQLLFPRGVAGDCARNGCSCTSFVNCLYCDKSFCFQHFVIDHHKC